MKKSVKKIISFALAVSCIGACTFSNPDMMTSKFFPETIVSAATTGKIPSDYKQFDSVWVGSSSKTWKVKFTNANTREKQVYVKMVNHSTGNKIWSGYIYVAPGITTREFKLGISGNNNCTYDLYLKTSAGNISVLSCWA